LIRSLGKLKRIIFKMKKQAKETIESHNAKEEVHELIMDAAGNSDVIETGFSKSLCPIYKILKEETFSPRGQILNLKAGLYTDILYKSALCMGAEQRSIPLIPFAKIIRKARKVLAEEGRAPMTDEVKKMIEEIKGYLSEPAN